MSQRMAKCWYFNRFVKRPRAGRKPQYGLDCTCPTCKGNIREGEDVTVCKCEVVSDPELPYFQARPAADFDLYYCGCQGAVA